MHATPMSDSWLATPSTPHPAISIVVDPPPPGWTASSPLFRNLYLEDRVASKRRLGTLLERDFDGVVMAHGSPLPTGGKFALQAAHSFL